MDKPTKDAPRAEWDEYAESINVDPEEYSNKESLIEAVEAELLLRDDDEEEEEEEEEEETDDSEFQFKAPKEHKKSPPEWRRAYDHARSKGNPEKTSILYANSHFQDEEFSA